MRFHRISAAHPGDIRLLRRFYDEVYVPEFPDPDEREDLETIERHLVLRDEGWYGENDYHVLVCTDGGDVVGGSIADYLAAPSAGVIEFLVVAPAGRSRGLGSRLLAETERAITASAIAAGAELRCLYAEVDDPLLAGSGSFDPLARARIWHRWGYRACAFPYVQPALSAAQQPVDGLVLVAKPVEPAAVDALPAQDVAQVVAEYMRWAMRIPDPAGNAEYRRMLGFLRRHPSVALRPLVEREPGMLVHEVTDPTDPALAQVVRVYESVFDDPLTAVPPDAFRTLLQASQVATGPDFDYHLWALRAAPGGEPEGMASFATLGRAGFGGYICTTGGLRGCGRFRGLLAQMEDRMLRDRPEVHGWYVECEGEPERSIFCRVGFGELAVPYVQPAAGRLPEHRLHLLYKPIGPRPSASTRLPAAACLDDVADIYRVFYDLPQPWTAPVHRRLAEALAGVADVPFLDDDTPRRDAPARLTPR